MVKSIRSKPNVKFAKNTTDYKYDGSMQDIIGERFKITRKI